MTFRDLEPVPGRPGLWLHADVACWAGGLPAPKRSESRHGRGAIHRIQAGGIVAWVRRIRRGGALARLLPDAFLGASRAMAEARALERLSRLGLAPRCLGLQVDGGALKRLLVAVEDVPGALDLLSLAQDGERDEAGVARAAGRVVRAMHEAGVAHADLNAANILVRRDAGGWRAFVIDLDGAVLRDAPVPHARRARDVLRLCRSIDKWDATASCPARARAAFLAEALPAPLRLGVLRAARWRWGWRWRLGRRPRPAPR